MADSSNYTHSQGQDEIDLVHEIYKFGLDASPAPMHEAAIVLGLITVGGIASRQFNVSGAGLNQNYILAAGSGTGKGAVKRNYGKLVSEVAKSCPSITDFTGMSYAASGPGILKHLATKINPVSISFFDEFGADIAQMGNPNNSNAQSKKQIIRELWSASGEGNTFDPMAYADVTKNTAPLENVNFNYVGCAPNEEIDRALDSSMASDGFLSRQMIVGYDGPIAPLNERHLEAFNSPPQPLIQKLTDLTAETLTLAHQRKVRNVGYSPDAEKHFNEYAEAKRLQANELSEGPARKIVNRSNLKARKIAATLAVGINFKQPCITIEQAKWATEFVDKYDERLMSKINSGDIGPEAGNQAQQRKLVMAAIVDWVKSGGQDQGFYPGSKTYKFWSQSIIPYSYISQKVCGYAAFKNDRLGARLAIKNTIEELLRDYDIIREVPPKQMFELIGCKARGFIIANAEPFCDPKLGKGA